jgi:monoamine oxidase
MSDVIIIGAGAAGLSAADWLTRSGKTVAILEARDRIGGRIYTTQPERFPSPVEFGAEFIHGDLPLTGELAQRSDTKLVQAKGELQRTDIFPDMDELMERLNTLEHDMTMGKFLELFFGDERYADLRESVTRMAEGLDCADIDKVSAISLRDEWNTEDESKQYYPVGGYGRMINSLADQLKKRNVEIKLNFIVREVRWKGSRAEIISVSGESWNASKVIITIPPSILKTHEIIFSPAIPIYSQAFQQIETGGAIKFFVEFDKKIWEHPDFRQMHDIHFLFSDAFVPTWWTQPHQETALLTGWLSGPRANSCTLTDPELRRKACESLASLFNVSEEKIKQHIRALMVINWVNDPFARGAYVYRTPESQKLMGTLTAPIDNTIFFAGEAFYEGPEMGTVEAALSSGRDAAVRLLQGTALIFTA